MSRRRAGRIIIAPADDGAWLRYEGMAKLPVPALHKLSSMDVARTFAIVAHQCHGWSIEERNSLDEVPGA